MGRSERHWTILLAGMMGAGKSSVGRALAQRLGRPFLDTDARIEACSGRSVAQIFAADGEAAFRALERVVLLELPPYHAVVALGGGAIVPEANRAILHERGALVWLDASPETLAARVGEGADRPLLAGMDEPTRVARLAALRDQREAAYASADVRIDTDGRTVDQVCDLVLEALGWERAA
jgi:shikimate kinase